MFRHERPQQGRYRQFHQIDCEAFGYPGPDIDAEVIQISARLWRKLGIRGLRAVRELARHAGIPAALSGGPGRLFLGAPAQNSMPTACDGSSPIRCASSIPRIPAMREVIDGAPRLLDHLDDESRRHFDGFLELLAGSGIAAEVDPRAGARASTTTPAPSSSGARRRSARRMPSARAAGMMASSSSWAGSRRPRSAGRSASSALSA